jgi:hypothetical protein
LIRRSYRRGCLDQFLIRPSRFAAAFLEQARVTFGTTPTLRSDRPVPADPPPPTFLAQSIAGAARSVLLRRNRPPEPSGGSHQKLGTEFANAIASNAIHSICICLRRRDARQSQDGLPVDQALHVIDPIRFS